MYIHTQSVCHNCFYYTSKPECAIPDDNTHTHTHAHTVLAVVLSAASKPDHHSRHKRHPLRGAGLQHCATTTHASH